MKPGERRRRIADLVKEASRASVEELAGRSIPRARRWRDLASSPSKVRVQMAARSLRRPRLRAR
jgi:hypothetical protein